MIVGCSPTAAVAVQPPAPLVSDSPSGPDGSSPPTDGSGTSDGSAGLHISVTVVPNSARPGDSVKLSFFPGPYASKNGYWKIDDCGAQLLGNSSVGCTEEGVGGSAVLTVPQNAESGTKPISWHVHYHFVWTVSRDGSGTSSGQDDGDVMVTVLPPRPKVIDSATPSAASSGPPDQGAQSNPVSRSPSAQPGVVPRSSRDPLRRGIPLVIALVAGAAATLLALWLRRRPRRPADRRVRVVPHPDPGVRVRIRRTPGSRTRVVRLQPHIAVTTVRVQESRK